MKKLTQTKQMEVYRNQFNEVIQALEVGDWEFKGRYEKGFLFENEEGHFLTVNATAHKWEPTAKTDAFDGYGVLEAYQEKQEEKERKALERKLKKEKDRKIKEEKEAEMAQKKAERE